MCFTQQLAILCAMTALGCRGNVATGSAAIPNPDGYETLELRYQGSGSQVSYVELAEDLGYLAPIHLNWVGNTISGPQDIQATVTGDVDFGVAFNGAIVNLIAAKAPITSVVGVSFIDADTWSGFYVLDGSPIRTARDFIGKKVGMNTVGAHSEFMLKEWLTRQGLTRSEIQDVTLVSMPPVGSEQALRSQQVDVAVLGSIVRDKAIERGGIHPVFTDYQLFGKFTSASYVLTNRLLREKPKTAHKFVEATAKAIEWARAQPRERVIERMQRIVARTKHGDANLLRYWRAGQASLPGGLLAASDFQVWIDWLVRDGQLKRGQVSAETMYSNDGNPYVVPHS